jgi:predicted TIM-barrel fold metal-dependent hydrolase
MPDLDYTLFDADNHYYEPPDCFTRYIEPQYRDKAIELKEQDGGAARVFVGDRPFTFLSGGFAGDTVAKAGALRALLHSMKTGVSDEGAVQEPMQPAYQNRDARLALMDQQGIESTFLFPTFGVCVEHFMKDDVLQMYANMHAFNRWLLEDWGFNHKDRIHAPPMLSLLDLDRAVDELQWVLDEGARIVALRPGPAFGRSPADPYFDPFWAILNEARVPVAFHIAESGYNEMMSVHWGEEANPSSHRQSAFQWSCCYGDRVIIDTVASLIFNNLFGRFPNLKVLSVENGSLWVSYAMKVMDKMKGMGRNGPWVGGYVKGRPSEVLKQHVLVSPYHEEDVPALVDAIGASQVLFGSDFPHPEGLAEPARFAELLADLPSEVMRMVMRENAWQLVHPQGATA